jgi:small conductance mechanosensitive channel
MFKLQSSRAILRIAFLGWLLLLCSPVWADQPPAAGVTEPPSYSEQANALLDEIQELNGGIGELEANLKEKQGVAAMILDSRIQDATHRALDLSHQLCQLVIDREAAEEDAGSFRKTAEDLLRLIPKRVRTDVQRQLASEDNGVDITAQSAIEQIAFEDERAELSKRLLESYGILLRNLQLSEQLGLETTQQRDFLREALAEAAQNQSIGLELARRYGKILERQSRALPDDAELAAKVRVSGERIKRLNDGLRQLVELMKQLDMRTVEYRQQLVAVTGTVTTDILDFEVLAGMLQRWLNTTVAWSKAHLPGIVFNMLLFLLIVWAAIALARLARRLVKRSLNRRPSNMSQLLRRMIISSTGNIVLILGLLFGLAQLGISVGPLLAGLGIAGFIVGFALQDTLGNFASGMLILFYRPYDVGDFIETNGVLGKVSRMSLVNTTVLTIDNQTLVLPNSKIWGDVIKNVTAQRQRRVDMVFSIGYADDIARAEEVLSEIVSSHEKVLDDPAPVVRLHTLNESSVDFVVRPWVMTEDYWDVYWDITRAVKIRFDESDISIPFPQRDIHIYATENAPETRRGELDIEQPSVPLTGTEPGDDPPAAPS